MQSFINYSQHGACMGRGSLQNTWTRVHSSNKWVRALLMLFFVGLGIFLLANSVTAATDVTIQVKDITDNTPISSLPILVKLTDIRTGMEDTSTEYIDAKGAFVYRLEPGNWRVELKIFDPKSDWIDYAGQRVVYIQKQEPSLERTFYLIPIGALEGVVMLEDKGLAGEAELDFQCSYSGQFSFPSKTDGFGSFKLPVVPAGKCHITASSKDHIGWVDVNITQGELKTVKVMLSESKISAGFSQFTPVFWVAVIVAALVVAYYIFRRKIKSELKKELKEEAQASKKVKRLFRRKTKKEAPASKEVKEPVAEEEQAPPPKKEPEPAAPTEPGLNPRARDIMETLNEREKKAVQSLLDAKGKSTQAKIRNHTGIPKTSLVRVFQSLETKKVISIEKIGKMKKITITDWFMGKE